MFKKVLPKQGFVFTPAYEEKGQCCVLIIDPQEDFMDDGSLPVPGAKNNMNRLVSFFEKKTLKLI
jgi:nicotinamidase-related amidase